MGQQPVMPADLGQHCWPGPQHIFLPSRPLSQQVEPGLHAEIAPDWLPQQMPPGLAQMPPPQQVEAGPQMDLPQQVEPGEPQILSPQQIDPATQRMAPHLKLAFSFGSAQHPVRPLSLGQHRKPAEQHMFLPSRPLGQHVDPGAQMPKCSQQLEPGLAHRPLPQQMEPGEQMDVPQQTEPGEPHKPPEVSSQQIEPGVQ